MSVSSDGQICWGVKLDEDEGLPWELSSHDFETWWLYECGYEPLFPLYDEKGDYLPGPEPSKVQIHEYYTHQSEFESAHPCPVELVNYCSYDYPMYIVAVSRTFLSCSRGYPEEIVVLIPPLSEEKGKLIKFMDTYFGEYEDPKWWLSSLYG